MDKELMAVVIVVMATVFLLTLVISEFVAVADKHRRGENIPPMQVISKMISVTVCSLAFGVFAGIFYIYLFGKDIIKENCSDYGKIKVEIVVSDEESGETLSGKEEIKVVNKDNLKIVPW